MERLQNCDTQNAILSSTSGLTSDEVNARIAKGQTNKVKNSHSKSYLKIFIDNFCSVFNLMCFACFLTLLFVADKTSLSNYLFVVIFMLNSIIGVVQEIKAKKTVERLSLVKAPTATVIRNGTKQIIPISDVVLDDILILSLGDQIPADCVVLDGYIEANESLLTGESVPVKKETGAKLLSGSFVSAGKCTARAERVGEDSYVQTISQKAKVYKKTRSELNATLNKIIKTIAIIIVPIAIGTVIVNCHVSKLANGTAVITDVVIATVSVVVGMIPAGMFFLTTLSLSAGIVKLGRISTNVQDMYSLEMLARVNVLCLDKTGTITDGNMSVREISQKTALPVDIRTLLYNFITSLGDENFTATAVKKYCEDGKETTFDYKPISKIPFSSAKKLSAVEFEGLGTFILGAPDFVLPSKTEEVSAFISNEASLGRRVLALARSLGSINGEELPNGVELIAFVVLEDNVRPEAIEAISWFKENDVAVKVISGDDPATVSEIARRAGVDGYGDYINLYGLSDEEVISVATKYTVFGRVSPEQKALLVNSLKASGKTVGMTGDGVNDILAMKEADCSITVASGAQATCSLANLVLLNNDFNSLPEVVKEGRRVINNIQRSASLYLMKTLFVMIFAIVSICTVSSYPFTTGMMLMLEFFIIGVPSLALSLQPNSERVSGKFISYVISHALPASVILVFNALVIKICYAIPSLNVSYEAYTTLSATALTLGGLVFLVILCRPYDKFRTLLVSVISAVVLASVALIIFTPLLQSFFALEPLTPISDNLINLGVLVGTVILDFPLLILTQKYIKK